MLDCVVVGGGPAGLTAAIYLARFRRAFALIDAGEPRAGLIPLSRNFPGFPEGISGEALLGRMRAQARRYGAPLRDGRAVDLAAIPGGFALNLSDGERLEARTVILATGVKENEPALPHCAEAVKLGLIRICPICDGFETVGRRVGVIGAGAHGADEALFIRTYSDAVALILVGEPPDETKRRALAEAGVEVVETSIEHVRLDHGEIRLVQLQGGEERRFDTLYSAFGVTPQSDLARQAGAACDEAGRLIAGDHQETSVPGLFAVGDLVRGLNQIGVAVGEAALAATAIHNRLPRPLA